MTFRLQHKNRRISPIFLQVNFRGKKYEISTGEAVPAKYWNSVKKRAKSVAEYPEAKDINDMLDEWERAASQTVKHFKSFAEPPETKDFRAKLREILYKNGGDNTQSPIPLLLDYMEEYAAKHSKGKSIACLKKYKTSINKIREYETERHRKLKFEDIDLDFYNDFRSWFFGKGFSTNYFGNTINVLKQMYREARTVDGLHSFTKTDHRDFVGTRVNTDSVYLNTEELDKINSLEFTPELITEYFPALDAEQIRKKIKCYNLVRDRFMIGAYTGLRVSDYARLRDLNIGDKFIKITARKTGKEAIIPINSIIRAILDRGFDPGITVSDQKINKHIKEIARMAGIDEPVLLNKHIAGKISETAAPKYELICTHTARRSFATNAYKAGVPTIAIMQITGHTKESDFLKYIRITKQENAEILMKHDFFK